jgi:hypothetical protein
MEAIRLLLAYACSKNVKVYQMDVKSVFLNGNLKKKSTLNNQKDFSCQRTQTMCVN